MEAAHDLESPRRLDGNVVRSIRLEAEGYSVDAIDQLRNVRCPRRRDRESIDAVSVSGDRLQLIEVHPDAQIPARHLGWIGSPPHDRADNHDVAGHSGGRRDRNAVADFQVCSLGERIIDRNSPWLPLYRRGGRATNR